DAKEALGARDLDLVVLSGSAADELLQHWHKDLPLTLSQLDRSYHQLAPAARAALDPSLRADDTGPSPRVQLRADGALVALLGRDAAAAHSLVATLNDNSKVPLIRGELAVIKNDAVQSFQGQDSYYVGSLSFWQWLWFHFSRHAIVLIVLALAVAIAAGLLVYGRLERRVKQRL